jgi:hypothetical protein
VLLKAAARLVNAPELQSRVEMISKLKRWDGASLPTSDPRAPVQRLFMDEFRGLWNAENIRSYFSKRLGGDVAALNFREKDMELGPLRHSLAAAGLDQEALLDFTSSLMEFVPTGDERYGYRITMHAPESNAFQFWVVREDGEYRLIGVPPLALEGIGALVLELLEKKDLKAAQWWLDDVAAKLEPASDGTGRPALTGLWSGVTEEARGPAAIRIAAATMIGASNGADSARTTLEQARIKAPTEMEKTQIDKAICETLAAAKKWNDLMVAAARLQTSRHFQEEGFRFYMKAATRAEKWKALETAALKKLETNADHVQAMQSVVLAKAKQGDWAGAAQWAKKLSAHKFAGVDEQIYVAWFTMARGAADTNALEALKKAKALTGSDRKHSYALGMMQAILGMADDAQAALSQAIGGDEIDALPAAAWAIHGKVCAQYGFSNCATSALEKARQLAQPKKDDELIWISTVVEK